MSHFKDIQELHKKFDLGDSPKLTFLNEEQQRFREEFLYEELGEFVTACQEGDMATALDSLIDLEVVIQGTAIMMGVKPELWEALWDDVHRANMSKVRGQTSRGVNNDLIKPEGWVPPQTHMILVEYAAGRLSNIMEKYYSEETSTINQARASLP